MMDSPKEPKKWYYSDWSLFMLFVTVGPLAIPLIWKNPRYEKSTKWVLTATLLILTVLMTWVFGYFFKKILAYYALLAETAA